MNDCSKSLHAVHKIGWIALVLATCICPRVYGSSERTAEEVDLVHKVVESIQSNYAAIISGEFSVGTKLRTVRLEGAKIEEYVKGTSTTRIYKVPLADSLEKVWFHGSRIKRESEFVDGKYEQHLPSSKEIWLLDDVEAWQYVPDSETAWRKPLTDVIAGQFDLRQIGIVDRKKDLIDVLVNDELLRTDVTKNGQEEMITLRMKDEHGLQIEIVFSSNVNNLPTSFEYTAPDGKPLFMIQVDYQRVETAKAWFPAKATRKVFAGSKQELSQISTREVLPGAKFNTPIPEKTFKLDLPTGTIVRDGIIGRVWRK